MNIDLRPDYIELVQNILQKHLPEDAKVYVFGSRAKWTAKEFSDLDLAIDAGGKKLAKKILNGLKEDFGESKLPYTVDVVDLNDITPEFRKIVETQKVTMPEPDISGWKSDKLINFCVQKDGVQTGPFGSQLHQEDYVEEGTPIITVEHLGDNRILHQNLPKVSHEDKERLKKYSLQTGDIVFSRVGSVDRRSLVRSNEDGWLFSGRCLRVRIDPQKADPAYVSYYFGTESFKEYMRSIAVGATMPSINTKILSDIQISVPSLSQQKVVGRIFATLDGKIELNQRMNATLEVTAQALFKSWFVDFDPVRAKAEGRQPEGMDAATAALFPDRFTDSPLGEIPQGWNKQPLSELIDLIGGGTPKTSKEEYWNGNIPWFSVVDAPAETDVFVIDTEKKITPAGVENSSTKILPYGTTIISARGTVGRVALVGVPMAMNQSCYGIQGKNGWCPFFTYLVIRRAVAELQTRAHGSVFDTITRDTFKTINFVNPNSAVIEKFEKTIAPLMARILNNRKENVSLSQTRDLLLPRLISGKLRVRDAEQKIKEAIG